MLLLLRTGRNHGHWREPRPAWRAARRYVPRIPVRPAQSPPGGCSSCCCAASARARSWSSPAVADCTEFCASASASFSVARKSRLRAAKSCSLLASAAWKLRGPSVGSCPRLRKPCSQSPAASAGWRLEIRLRSFDRLAVRLLRDILEVFLPLVQLRLRGFGRRENLQGRRGRLALGDHLFNGVFHRLFQILRSGLFGRLAGGLFGCTCDGAFHRRANPGVKPFGVGTARLARFLDDCGGTVRSLLHHFLHGRIRDPLHRNLDGALHSFMKLRIELLAHHCHFVRDGGLRGALGRLVEIPLASATALASCRAISSCASCVAGAAGADGAGLGTTSDSFDRSSGSRDGRKTPLES